MNMVAHVTGSNPLSAPGLHVSVLDSPVQVTLAAPWVNTLMSPFPSLRGTPGAGAFTGAPTLGGASGPGGLAPQPFQNNFSFSFTPKPTYWVTFGSGSTPDIIDAGAGNLDVQLLPQLKA
ncbi:MAG: hypothetical protein ACN6PJ_00060 [Achromobacter sp.]|uniref:hypothetical protein n=1 Tax=Achromobacter sp. TaxID=134375 RepID=UPI003CFF98A5